MFLGHEITWADGRSSKTFMIPNSASWVETESLFIEPTQGFGIKYNQGATLLYALFGMCQKNISGILQIRRKKALLFPNNSLHNFKSMLAN